MRIAMKKYKKLLSLFLIATCFALLTTNAIYAAEVTAEGVAVDVSLTEKNIPDGSIISLTDGKYLMSTIPYDPSVYGVITDNPAASFSDSSSSQKRPAVNYGKVKVRVSAKNGNINAGDLITTSEVPGVGQKATENGYVVGIAMEDYHNNNPKAIGSIYITLHLNYGVLSTNVKTNLLTSLKRGGSSAFLSPINTLRYVVAGLISILSFAGGFWFFGRVSSRGVEAIGRNPLARRFILLTVIFNVGITIAVMGLGVALAYVILVI
jgi:hypothetical protein